MNCPSCSPTTQEVSTANRKKKKNASSKRSSEVAEVTEICLGSWERLRGVGDVGPVQEV